MLHSGMALSTVRRNSIRSAWGARALILLVRSIHGLITLYFLTCIGSIYYAGISGRASTWAYLAVASLVVEGIVVLSNHGNCPLGAIHHRVGDDKTFFELLLPPSLAKRAVPVLGAVAVVGIALLFR